MSTGSPKWYDQRRLEAHDLSLVEKKPPLGGVRRLALGGQAMMRSRVSYHGQAEISVTARGLEPLPAGKG